MYVLFLIIGSKEEITPFLISVLNDSSNWITVENELIFF